MELAVPKMDQKPQISFVLGSNIIKIIKNDRVHRFWAHEGENIPSSDARIFDVPEYHIEYITKLFEIHSLIVLVPSVLVINYYIYKYNFHFLQAVLAEKVL